jgi:hypothetical protein
LTHDPPASSTAYCQDSQPSDIDIERAARAKLKAEEQEKEKQAAEAKKASQGAQTAEAPLSAGLFRMVADDFEAPPPSSPEPPRKASGEAVSASVTPAAAYPVNAQVPLQRSGIQGNVPSGRDRGLSADMVILRGDRASKEFFGVESSEGDLPQEEAEPNTPAGMPEPAPEAAKSSQDAQSASQLIIIQQLFEQLQAERKRADRLEEKVHELTEQLMDAHEKHAGVLERENQRWAQVHQNSGLLKNEAAMD